MIHKAEPKGFNPRFTVVGCFVEHDDRILLLKRQGHKPQGNRWGVPAGKTNKGEDHLETMIREINEETGLGVDKSDVSFFDRVYVRCSSYDFVYHMFHVKLDNENDIKINISEHKEFRWTCPKNALEMPLIHDLGACIKLFYNI